MKYVNLKRKRDQEKTDLRRKLEGKTPQDTETLIIRKNQFNRRQVHVDGQGGGQPPLRAPQPPQQPGIDTTSITLSPHAIVPGQLPV